MGCENEEQFHTYSHFMWIGQDHALFSLNFGKAEPYQQIGIDRSPEADTVLTLYQFSILITNNDGYLWNVQSQIITFRTSYT